MNADTVQCPLCGHRFATEGHTGCASCPVGASCATVCCPACGYSTIDPSRSGLVRLGRLFRGKSHLKKTENATAMTLNEVIPGCHASIAGFSEDLPSRQREHLQAYGLVEGRTVRILQHSPATVVRVEHLELALEAELAGKVKVKGETLPEQNPGGQRQRRAWFRRG